MEVRFLFRLYSIVNVPVDRFKFLSCWGLNKNGTEKKKVRLWLKRMRTKERKEMMTKRVRNWTVNTDYEHLSMNTRDTFKYDIETIPCEWYCHWLFILLLIQWWRRRNTSSLIRFWSWITQKFWKINHITYIAIHVWLVAGICMCGCQFNFWFCVNVSFPRCPSFGRNWIVVERWMLFKMRNNDPI